MMASVLGSRGAVGTAGRGWGWEVRYPSCWMASGTFCIDTRNEEAPNDARLVMTGFLRRLRNLTSNPENRPTMPSQ